MSDDQQRRFDEIYRRHYAHVIAYARRRVPGEPAQDVVAEVFTTAWRHLDRIPTSAELPWLYQVASNAVATERRRMLRQGRLQGRINRYANQTAATTEDYASRIGDTDEVLVALHRLSARDQEALLLTSWEDLDTAAAAGVAGCSVTAFKVRLHRARRRLGQLLILADAARPHVDPPPAPGGTDHPGGNSMIRQDDTVDVRLLLAARNPVALDDPAVAGAVDSREAAALRRRILATPSNQPAGQASPHVHRNVRRVSVAVIVSAAAVTVAITGLPTGHDVGSTAAAYAATPPMLRFQYSPATGPNASPVLEQIATRESRQRGLPGKGSVDYLEYRAWGRATSVSHGEGQSSVAPLLVAQWTTSAGQVYRLSASGPAQSLTATSKESIQPGPSSLHNGAPSVADTERLFDLTRLSRDPAVLAGQLIDRAHPIQYVYPASFMPLDLQRLDNILFLYRQQAISPDPQAAMWRVLARIPGWVDLGSVTDRLGRHGIAYDSAFGQPTCYVLTFNSTSGALLGHEKVVITKVGEGTRDPLGVRIPAVIEYNAYIITGHVPDTHTQL